MNGIFARYPNLEEPGVELLSSLSRFCMSAIVVWDTKSLHKQHRVPDY